MGHVENYHYYKGRNRCVWCHKQDAFTLNGRTYCADCIEKAHSYRKKWEAKNSVEISLKKKNLRAERADAGLCTKCGIKLPDNHYKMCSSCRAYNTRRKREEMQRKGMMTITMKQERSWDGFCYRCGNPVKQGETARGTPIRLCEQCYESLVDAGKKGLQKIRDMNNGSMVFVQSSYVMKSKGYDAKEPA